ncbi:Uncharacterised protein [Mycobacteroides abscessus subsp. abscessus]|nr:Uncharacterised protein [Mycobacteroides abscessus subsp. abscessus]
MTSWVMVFSECAPPLRASVPNEAETARAIPTQTTISSRANPPASMPGLIMRRVLLDNHR